MHRILSVPLLVASIIFGVCSFIEGAETKSDAAWTAWRNGNVVEATTLAAELGDTAEHRHLLFLCSFVQGQYETALATHGDIPPSYDRYQELDRPVVDCYLHLGRNHEAAEFAKKRNVARLGALQLRARHPLKVSLDSLTTIPFAKHRLTDYFPAFRAELEGHPVTIHIDTGSAFIAMGPDHAESLGIELIDYGQGNHGHRTVKLSFGIAKTFKLGDAILKNVPVIVFPTLRGQQMNFGTCVLKQFLSTLDYPGGRLILSPHDNAELRDKHLALLPENRVEMPFYMWGDHYMFARGSVGDFKRLNFFMDSGLVALRKTNDDPTVQASFTSSRERYVKWGIAESALNQSIFKSPLPVSLGPLKRSGLWFQTGPGGEAHGQKTFGGVQMHGLLGHAFVKNYSWSLDFENCQYIFSEDAPGQSRRDVGTKNTKELPEEPASKTGFSDAEADGIKTFLQDNFADKEAGMVIGILDENGHRVFAVGKLDNGTDQGVNGDTIFEIGSNTKTFTALLLLDLVKRGKMRLDDPVAKYLAASVEMPTLGGNQITLLNLAAQDSGLPFNAENLSSKAFPENYNEYTVENMYTFLSEYELTSKPGSSFQYSNIGMSLLGHVIERAAGADFETLVVNRICRPLQMEDTRIKLTPELQDRLAIGHDKSGQRAAPLNMQVMEPAGSLHSTVNDLLKYLSANLGFSRTDLSPLMKDMQVIRHTGPPPWGKTAMPWFDEGIYNPPGSEVLGHGGGTAGFSSFVGFDKLRRRGVVVLSNQRALRSTGVGWTVLQGMPLSKESGTKYLREFVGLGVGLEIDEKTGVLRITNVVAKSPADQAGLSTGLLIQKINGVSVEGKSIKECLGMMVGPIGTKVRLELVDAKRKETKTVELSKQKFLLSL